MDHHSDWLEFRIKVERLKDSREMEMHPGLFKYLNHGSKKNGLPQGALTFHSSRYIPSHKHC